MMILARYEYYRPSTVEEAVSMLKKENTIIAGGSDVMPQLKTATIAPEALIDLSKISEMHTVEETDDGIYIGAMVTLSHLAKNELILRKLIALSQAARNVASPQIRNRGTVGGNLMQARRCFYYNQTKEWRRGIPVCFKVGGDRCIQIPNSPVCRAIYYSDMAPALITYGAQALVHTAEGSQLVSCQELMETHCKDQDKPMLIEKFFIPKSAYSGAWAKFDKYSLRGSIDFPTINFACVRNGQGVRLTVGAIATHVLELVQTEGYLNAQGSAFSVEEATKIALDEMKKKSEIVRESGISVQVKRGTFCYVEAMLKELKEHSL